MFERHAPGELRWTWHGRGSPHQRMSVSRQEGVTLGLSVADGRTSLANIDINGNAVLLNTDSRERAERGRDLLASHLGALVGAPLMSLQDLETALKEHPGTTPEDPGLPPEVAEQAIHAYLDKHYRSTLDSPLPLLGGKTPNQAAKTQKGRAQVVAWLKNLENSEIRRAARDGQKPYDMSWMWKALQLEESR
jgi:hypothetical protein